MNSAIQVAMFSLSKDCWLTTRQFVAGRHVTDVAVQAMGIVIVHGLFDELPRFLSPTMGYVGR